ncbi:transcriptional regulator [Marinomonas agarivorans]|nr:transcriptional regulator [Marinomonas agarivorans]
MYVQKIALVTLLLFGFFTQPSWAQSHSDGFAMMDRMINAFSKLSYEGVFVRFNGADMDSMQVRHSMIDGVEYESLVDLDGSRIEVIRIGDSVICVYPNISFENNTAPVSAPFQKFKELNHERVRQGYEFAITDEGLVAGRKAQKLELRPKDAYRFAHHFWLDINTGFLLRHDTLDESGNFLSKVQFTSLNTSPNLKKTDFVPRMGVYTEHVVRSTPKSVDGEWTFDWLPNGFSPVWDGEKQMEGKTSMMMISDGITSISVFIEPAQTTKSLSVTKMGQTLAGEKTYMMNGVPYLLTAVGEVPDITIRKLLSAIVPRKSDSSKS